MPRQSDVMSPKRCGRSRLPSILLCPETRPGLFSRRSSTVLFAEEGGGLSMTPRQALIKQSFENHIRRAISLRRVNGS